MCNEAYCSYEVAKLLKEKGFDWKCNGYFVVINKEEGTNAKFHICSVAGDANNSDGNLINCDKFPHLEYVSAPTQQMACQWLRIEKGIYVYAVYGDYPTLNEEYWVPEIGSLKDFIVSPDFYQEYNTPEDAVESALKYCLTELI